MKLAAKFEILTQLFQTRIKQIKVFNAAAILNYVIKALFLFTKFNSKFAAYAHFYPAKSK